MRLTKAEFARKYKLNLDTVRKHVQRKKLVETNRLIYEDLDINEQYIERRLSEIDGVLDISESVQEREVSDKEKAVEIKKNKSLDTLRTEKIKAEIEKLEIGNQKAKGELVPIELIIPLFVQYSKSMMTAYKNATENVLVEIGHRKSLSREEKADLKTQFVRIINLATDEGAEDTQRSIGKIVMDYSNKRGVGESK